MSQLAIAILTAVGAPILLKLGFSGSCSNELLTIIPAIGAGIWAWIAGVRGGHFTLGGKKV